METKWNRKKLDRYISCGTSFWIIPAQFDNSEWNTHCWRPVSPGIWTALLVGALGCGHTIMTAAVPERSVHMHLHYIFGKDWDYIAKPADFLF